MDCSHKSFINLFYQFKVNLIKNMQTQKPKYPIEQIFSNLKPFLDNKSPFCNNEVTSEDFFEIVDSYEILVVGAGGLGCEIVKNLAMSGVRKIHLVDMDTIDLTNLNRQFLFRQRDVGKYKADVVAEFVMKRCPGVKVIPHKKKIQELSFSFYQKFNIIIGGLDNVQARKYLNNIAFNLNLQSQQGTACYYIDGATEGFEGQALLVQPFQSSCYECSIFEGLGTQIKANYCTIANTPRTPQHCVQYVLEILWKQTFGDQKRDNDNLEHMNWVYEKSLQRARKFNIEGLTEILTLGVAKNIIPAIASTNALIASILTGQVLKLLTGCGPSLKNYILYKGAVSIGSDTYESARKSSCQACKMRQNKLQTLQISLSKQRSVRDIFESIKAVHKYIQFSFITHKNKTLLNSSDSQRYQTQLNTTIDQLIRNGRFSFQEVKQVLYVADNSLKSELKVHLKMV